MLIYLFKSIYKYYAPNWKGTRKEGKEEEEEEKKKEEEDVFAENDTSVETSCIAVSGRVIIDALDDSKIYTIDDITQLFNKLT